MDDEAVWRAVDVERGGLADLFAGLTEEQLDVSSLCEGWSVRHVLAHLTLAQPSVLWVARNMARARFDYHRMIRDTGLVRASQPTGELVGVLRGMVGTRKKAPGITCREPLIDTLVHGQDVAVPLGIVRTMPVDAAAEALQRVMTMPRRMAFELREHYTAMTLVATDAGLEIGSGPRVEATAQDLLLAVTGRKALQHA